MKNNKKGFSIVIVLGIVIVINLIAIGLLSYIIPFSKNTKGIENSSIAYYQAISGIENVLYELNGESVGYETGKLLDTSLNIDYSFDITSNGLTLPPTGKGNSDYDFDRNIISMGNPIQLEIGDNKMNFTMTKFIFRVPDINGPDPINQTLSGSSTTSIINWQISTLTKSLNSIPGDHIMGDDICDSDSSCSPIFLGSKRGEDLDATSSDINDFYDSYCNLGESCILKLSIINTLELTSGASLPYLEWQIETPTNLPLRYSLIEVEGKSYGYKKKFDIRVSQQTTNEAFDFTVFQ